MSFRSRAEDAKPVLCVKRYAVTEYAASGFIPPIEPQGGIKLLIVKINKKPESLLKDTFPDYLFTT
jgi:hypothetical protein